MKKTFLIQGSEAEPYSVEFLKEQFDAKISCTCQSGFYGQFCKHIESVLSLNKIGLKNYGQEDYLQMLEIISGTTFEANYQKLSNLVKEKEVLDKKIKTLKKTIIK